MMQNKAWMKKKFFKEFLTFFKRLVLGGIFHSNKHLLILDRHGFHIMIKSI
jgi:hypothetical protein